MKKIIGIAIVITLTILFCTGCEVSNTELANSLDGNMTRLVYSVGYLDSVSTTDIQDLTTNTSYFAGSSYNLNTRTTSGVNTFRDANYRSNVYSNSELAGGYANYVETADSNYNNLNSSASGINTCTNCNNPIPANNATLNNTQTTTNSVLNAGNGNATTTELGGLCNNCKNLNISALSQNSNAINNVNNTNTETDTVSNAVNYVNMSLIETSASDLNEILLSISQKRGIIMLYCTDLRSGNIALSTDDKSAISEYITIIKETINYLNNNSTTLTAHINNIKNIAYAEGAQELINAKLIRANEVLKTRYAKLDTCIDSLDAIIAILQRNIGVDYSSSFLNNSTYLNTTLSNNATGNANGTITDTTTTPSPTQNTINNPANNNTTTNTINGTTNNEVLPNNTTAQTTQNSHYNYNGQSDKQSDNTIINYNYAGSNNGSYNLDQTPNTNISNVPSTKTNVSNNNSLTSNTSACCPNDTKNISNITQEPNNTSNILNGLGNASYNKSANNPKGIGIQTPETSPITGITYNSNSVNVPRPGTLISAINLKNETMPNTTNPINTEELSKDNELKLVDNKNDKNINNIDPKFKNNTTNENTKVNEQNQLTISEDESNIQTTPLTNQSNENVLPNTPSSTPKPLIIKELGAKALKTEPIYSAENTFKLLPFNPN